MSRTGSAQDRALNDIVDALLKIDEVADPDTRGEMILGMPPGIRSRVVRIAGQRGDVVSWIKACARFPDGHEALVNALRTYAGPDIEDVDRAVQVIDRSWSDVVAQAEPPEGPPALPPPTAGRAAARRITDWDPAELGVHPSIVAVPGPSTGLPVLTEYVPRNHDYQLRRLLPPARNTVVVLWGGPATGKTRAVLEAVRDGLSDWPVMRPLDADGLLAGLAGTAPDTDVVIWLDQIDGYLSGDELVPAALRRLMDRATAGRVLVVATADRDRWHSLVEDGNQGHHLAAFLRSVVPIAVPDTVDGPHLLDWRTRGRRDPRLALAEEAGRHDGRLVQALTGGPALVTRHESPMNAGQSWGRVVVTGAMELRQLGLSAAVPEDLLTGVADALLDPERRAGAPSDWFAAGLESACQDVNGVAALVPAATPAGRRTFRLHGYLDRHSRSQHRRTPPPAAVWDLLLDHPTEAADAVALADAARRRHLYRHAVRFATVAAEAGSLAAARRLAGWLDRAGAVEEAQRRLRQCASAGDPAGMRMLAQWLSRHGEREEADEALRAAAAVDAEARLALAGQLAKEDDHAGLVQLWRAGAAAGDPDARLRLVALLSTRPETRAEVKALLRQGAVAGDELALTHLIGVLDDAAALGLLRELAGHGSTAARRLLVDRLEADGRLAQAAQECRPLSMAGDGRETLRLARLLDLSGSPEEAERCLQTGADAGSTLALSRLVARLDRTDRSAQADERLRRAAAAGQRHALAMLVERLTAADRDQDAEATLRAAAGRGDADAMRLLAARADADHRPEAESWLSRAAADGDSTALRSLVSRLDRSGRADESRELLIAAARHGDTLALREVVRRADTADDTERWLRYSIECGTPDALGTLVRWLTERGAQEEADRLHRFGIEPGGSTARGI